MPRKLPSGSLQVAGNDRVRRAHGRDGHPLVRAQFERHYCERPLIVALLFVVAVFIYEVNGSKGCPLVCAELLFSL